MSVYISIVSKFYLSIYSYIYDDDGSDVYDAFEKVKNNRCNTLIGKLAVFSRKKDQLRHFQSYFLVTLAYTWTPKTLTALIGV